MHKKRKVMFTVDVEALLDRSPDKHVEKLIWGKFGNAEFGIGKMMDIADKYNVKLTMFLDYAETDNFGDEIIDVGREIVRRGHDLQLHLHISYFKQEFLQKHSINNTIPMERCPKEYCIKYLDHLLESHAKVTNKNPIAYRAGGMHIGLPILDALRDAGIKYDSSCCAAKVERAPASLEGRPFLWWGENGYGICEIPISCVPMDDKNAVIYDFNSNIFCNTFSLEKIIENNRLYREKFFTIYPEHAILVMIMHSRSFLYKNDAGHYSTPAPFREKIFEAIIADCAKDMTVLSITELDDLMHSHPSDSTAEAIAKADWHPIITSGDISGENEKCAICETPVTSFVQFKYQPGNIICPMCRSSDKQRSFLNLYRSGYFGKDIFKDKIVLHVSPTPSEEFYMKTFPIKKRYTIDIDPSMHTDIVADVSDMPSVDSCSFDVIYCSYVLSFAFDFKNAIKEFSRVLKPGGILLEYERLSTGKTIEFNDMDKVTSYYKKWRYDKYKIGYFRNFGKDDYESFFQQYFKTRIFLWHDMAANSDNYWLYGVKAV